MKMGAIYSSETPVLSVLHKVSTQKTAFFMRKKGFSQMETCTMSF
jgi:hypothetical protein